MSFYPLFVLFCTLSALRLSSAFSFTSTAPSQCDPLNITWTGGSGSGYYLSVIPIFGVPVNISIPQSAYSNGTGSFSTTLQSNSSDKVVLVVSDSTGFGAGGTSQLLSVGNSLGGSCNLTAPSLGFTFILDPPPTQCQTSQFSNYIEDQAVAPTTIIGVIPGGDTFVLNPGSAKTFNWVADIYNGTQLIFLMYDSQFRQGGSELYTVGLSGDLSCIKKDSPSSTSSGPSSTGSPSSSSTTPATPGSSKTGAIAGSVLGALIFLAVLITLGLFFLRQRQERQKARTAGGSEFRRYSRPAGSALDLTADTHQTGHLFNSPLATPITPYGARNEPPSAAAAHPPAHYQPHSRYLSARPEEQDDPFSDSTTSLHGPASSNAPAVDPFMERSSSAGQRKSGMSAYKPSRYVMHVDAEDELPENEEGIIEVPPEYSATRPPARGLSETGSYTSTRP